MSLTFALTNALSGLRASSQQADVISTNISNALTESYGRRSVVLAPVEVGGLGGGVRVEGVTRAEAPARAEARRLADAAAGGALAVSESFARLADAVGDPGAPDALATAADRLDAALSRAADTPENALLLADAARSAGEYAASINRIATEAMALRTAADESIANQVATINQTLSRIQSLNLEIRARVGGGDDAVALMDQREALIREISSIIPVRVVRRDLGEVALFAANGGQLLDGAVIELGFEAASIVTPDLRIETGGLAGLTTGGRPVSIGRGEGDGLFDGGSLAAAFELRDRLLPEMADSLDALALDAIERTAAAGVDPTLAPGAPALFTDAGAAFAGGDATGLALRIGLNVLVDPDRGGDAQLLRDGLGAAASGFAGDATILLNLRDSLRERAPAPFGTFLTGERGAAGFAAELSAAVLTASARVDEAAAFERGRAVELGEAARAATGVDTDQELSKLLLVEQSFNANARVVQVIDDLLARLISI